MAKKYLYNGIELPELPEWDKTTYPYAAIFKGVDAKYRLYLLLEPLSIISTTYDGLGGEVLTADAVGGTAGTNYLFYMTPTQEYSSWGERYESAIPSDGEIALLEDFPPIWSNYDILYHDGSVYLAASDPIPVTTTPIPSDAYIVKGGKLYKVKGGSAQNILTFDSVDEMNAASAPDGTIALVPSEGESGGGLSVVELTTIPTDEGSALTEEENAVMTKAFAKGLSIIVKFDPNIGITATASYPFAYLFVEGMSSGFSCVVGGYTYNITTGDGSTWVFSRTSNQEET